MGAPSRNRASFSVGDRTPTDSWATAPRSDGARQRPSSGDPVRAAVRNVSPVCPAGAPAHAGDVRLAVISRGGVGFALALAHAHVASLSSALALRIHPR